MKVYNKNLQERLERYLEENKLSQAKAAPLLGLSQGVLSGYRNSNYERGDIEAVEKKLSEFFQIQDEKDENTRKTEAFYSKAEDGYVRTSISEGAYKTIRYCQLEKGIVVIDGDAGIGKTRAAAKFIKDNPHSTVYVKASPCVSSVGSLLRVIAKALSISTNKRAEELSGSIQERLKQAEKVLIIDEAQNLTFKSLEEIKGWVDENIHTDKKEIGIVLIGNAEIYNRMTGKQEAIFSQQYSRVRLHSRFETKDIQIKDVEMFFPVLKEKKMDKEIDYLFRVSRSKWGIRGMVNIFNNAANNEDISLAGLEKMANTMGILFV